MSWEELPAVTRHSISGKRSLISSVWKTARSSASFSSVVSGRIASSASTTLGRPVLVGDRHRDDLAAEVGGLGGLVRAGREDVDRAAVDAVARRDQLGGDPLRDEARGVALVGRGAEVVRADPCRAHRHAAHRLDAAGHDDVVDAAHDPHRREVDGLLAGAAAAVDGRPTGTCSGRPAPSHAQRPIGPACSETWLTQPVITSSTSAGSSASLRSIKALDRLPEQLGGVEIAEGAPRLAVLRLLSLRHRGADGVDDHCGS